MPNPDDTTAKPSGRGLTRAERERIVALHGEGHARNEIARIVRRSPSTVSGVVHEAGLSFERGPGVIAATEAQRVDNAARRAAAIARLYAVADGVFDRLQADTFATVGYDRGGNAIVTTLDASEAPPADIRHLSATAANMLHSAAKLEAVDAGRHGNSGEAVAMAVKLGEGIRALVGAADNDGDGGEGEA